MPTKRLLLFTILAIMLVLPSTLFSQTNLFGECNLGKDSVVVPSIIHNVNGSLIVGSEVYIYKNNFLSYQNAFLVRINQATNSVDTAISLYTPSTLKEVTEYKLISIINHDNNLVSVHRKFYQGRNPNRPTISIIINYLDTNLTLITTDTIELLDNVKSQNLNSYKIRCAHLDSLFIYSIVYDSIDGNPQTRFVKYDYRNKSIIKNRLYTDNYIFGLDASTISLNSSNTLFSFALDNNNFGNVTRLNIENFDIIQKTFIRNKTIFNSPFNDNIVYCLDNVNIFGYNYLLNITESTSFDQNNKLILTDKLNLKKIDSSGVVVNAKWLDCNVPSNIDYSPFYRDDLRFITSLNGKIYFVYDPDVGNSFYIYCLDTSLNTIWNKEIKSTSTSNYHISDVGVVENNLYFSGRIVDSNGILETFVFRLDEYGVFTGSSEKELEISKNYIFPNPTNTFINLPFGLEEVFIYDPSGREYFCKKEDSRIDISELNPGVYIILFNTSTGKQTQRIVKY